MQSELPELSSVTSHAIRQELEQSFQQQLLGLPSLESILSQTVRNEPVLKRVDIFLQVILNHWYDVEQFIAVKTVDVLALFKNKSHSSKWKAFKKTVKDPSYMIADQLLLIAKKMNAMKTVLTHQNMVHLPKTSKDIKRLIESADDGGDSKVEMDDPTVINDNSVGSKHQTSSLHHIIAIILLRNRQIYTDTDHYQKHRLSSKSKGSRLRSLSSGFLRKSSGTSSVFNDDEDLDDETTNNNEPESSPAPHRRQKRRTMCEGCGNKISLHRSPEKIITYECGYLPDQLVFFHDIHCENLRKYKECIRHFVCEEIVEANAKLDSQIYVRTKNTIEYGTLLLQNFNLLINIENMPGSMPIPSQKLNMMNKQRRSVFRNSSDGFLGSMRSKLSMNKNLYRYDDNEHIDTKVDQKWTLKLVQEQRQIAVRLLSQKKASKAFGNNSQCFSDIPIAIQYSDFSIFGEILWIFVVQQLGITDVETVRQWISLIIRIVEIVEIVEIVTFY